MSKVKDDIHLQEVSEISGAVKFINKWEKRFDTVLGRFYEDNGKSLSGGQWQMTGLARAFFRKANFIILDEPSAALDPLSEDRIFNMLYSEFKNSSALTITHRLCNVINCDKIIVLEEGRVLEVGAHTDLLSRGGRYSGLYRLQSEKYSD